jgi:CheY-like chemotaxis protein
MKILVIEEEPSSLKLANLVLSSEGHQVSDAHSAEQAIQAILENQPQIILVDLGLPGMDGFDLTRRLKQDPKTRHIPIIAITGYPDQFPRDLAFAAGCDAYIVKPIDTRRIAGQVTAVADRFGKPEA